MYVMLASAICLCLLFSLLASRFLLRRVLLPEMDVKMPPSGAHPWSRRRMQAFDELESDDKARSALAARITVPELVAVNSSSRPDSVDFDEFSSRFELASTAFNARYGLSDDTGGEEAPID